MWDALKIAEQTTYLLDVFREPLKPGGPGVPGADGALPKAGGPPR